MAAKTQKKPDTAGFTVGHGYHSSFSGNWCNFLGVDSDGRFHFYRRFSQQWERLSRAEALRIFNPNKGESDPDFGEDDEDKFDLDQFSTGRM